MQNQGDWSGPTVDRNERCLLTITIGTLFISGLDTDTMASTIMGTVLSLRPYHLLAYGTLLGMQIWQVGSQPPQSQQLR